MRGRQGIFSKEETSSKQVTKGMRVSCVSCGLYRNCLSPRMEAYGNFKRGILNVGEAPGEEEDKRGKQWQGRMGRKLKLMYRHYGIDLFEDCANINGVNCRPTGNETPTTHQVNCCRPRVQEVIQRLQPRLIMCFGQSAVESVIGDRWPKGRDSAISMWRGYQIPDQKYGAFVCPVFHPSYVYRDEGKVKETIWFNDMEAALARLDQTPPVYDLDKLEQDCIEYVHDWRQLRETLGMLRIQGSGLNLRTVDIEATGLKPDAPGHQIVCLAITLNREKVYSFPMPKRPALVRELQSLLRANSVHWCAHNMAFEQRWFRAMLDADYMNWGWDTMLYAHRMRSTKGTKRLKFQVYVNFGIPDYSSEIEPFLEADKQNANSFNRLMELWGRDKRSVLKYCGFDSLFTHRLAEDVQIPQRRNG